MKYSDQDFWTSRYKQQLTGWDVGYPTTPITDFVDQLEDKNIRILIPGAGNAYEAEYLWEKGFKHTNILDIAAFPIKQFIERNPTFPKNQAIQGDFFKHKGAYDLIIEQTFFCSFPPFPESRKAYAKKMYELLNNCGMLVGVWFNFPLTGDMQRRPFGGSKDDYLSYFDPHFSETYMEMCYNSILPRQGSELFGIMKK